MASVFSAKLQGGVIVAGGVELPEGATVMVVVDEPADDYAELTADEEAELEATIAAADRGESVPWLTSEIRQDLEACSAYATKHGSFAGMVREHDQDTDEEA